MAFKRHTKSVDLKRASLATLEKCLAESKVRVGFLEGSLPAYAGVSPFLLNIARDKQMSELALRTERLRFHMLEKAVAKKRAQQDSLVALRAAAASNATQTRRVGDAVKRKLTPQPWCPYCGGELGPNPHADHIYPVAKGGRSVPKNMVYVCSQCNSMKKDLTLAAFIRKFSLDRVAIEGRLQQLYKDF